MKTDHNIKVDKDFILVSIIRQIHSETRGAYGSRRTSKRLRSQGHNVGRYRSRSLMKKAGVSVKHRKKLRITTDSKHNLPVAPNLLNRSFQVDMPDTVWCSDITYLWTMEGWLYLAVVIDLYARKVVGWAMSRSMKASLVTDALSMAYWRRKPGKGLIHHSDRGSQYAGSDYQKLLNNWGMKCSMSRKGDCWDNAVAESFFHTLKVELIHRIKFRTRDEAKRRIFEYVEMYYNRRRAHSTLGNLSPFEYEKQAI